MNTNLEEMTTKELKALAKEQNIEVPRKCNKAELINLLSKNEEEDTKMSDVNENVVVATEGNDQEAIPTQETAKVEDKKYFLEDGTECSRSAYIRELFKKDMSRQDIAKKLDVKYYIVYSATANMFNAVHPEGAAVVGRGGAIVAKVNADLKFVNAEGLTEVPEVDEAGNPVLDENGAEILRAVTAEEAVQVNRADLMRELFEAGKTRTDLKDYFGVPYATVYAATKDVDAPEGTTKGGRKTLVHPVTGLEVNRADYIRELYADGKGMDRREIAKQLTKLTGDLVDYATVWAATKPAKAEAAKTEAPEVPTDVVPEPEPEATAKESTDIQ